MNSRVAVFGLLIIFCAQSFALPQEKPGSQTSPTQNVSSLYLELTDLAAEYDVERGEKDVLVIDEENQLEGVLTAEKLTLQTEWGDLNLAFTEIAAILGGGGINQQAKVFLRNGEIFRGKIPGGGWQYDVEEGVQMKLNPSELKILMLHSSKDDKILSNEATAILETGDGQRMALTETPGTFKGSTAWGTVNVSMNDLQRLELKRGEQPLYQVHLLHNARLTIMPDQAPVSLTSLRFGKIAVELPTCRTFYRFHPDARPAANSENPPQETANSDAKKLLEKARLLLKSGNIPEAQQIALSVQSMKVEYDLFDDRPEHLLADIARIQQKANATENQTNPALPANLSAPLLVIAEQNSAVGILAVKELNVKTAAGLRSLPAETIQKIEVDEDDEIGSFRIELTNGNIVQATIPGGTIPFTVYGDTWQIPAHHLVAFRQITETTKPAENGENE